MRGRAPYDGKELSKKLEIDEARQKIARYCAYQERAHSEVQEKLFSFGLSKDEVEETLAWLIAENYVNEQRYAVAFAGGKFRVKRWGKIKIRQYLKHKLISEYGINKAIASIEDSDYLDTIDLLIEKGIKSTKAPNEYELRHKISRSLISKGYEPDLVWDRIKIKI